VCGSATKGVICCCLTRRFKPCFFITRRLIFEKVPQTTSDQHGKQQDDPDNLWPYRRLGLVRVCVSILRTCWLVVVRRFVGRLFMHTGGLRRYRLYNFFPFFFPLFCRGLRCGLFLPLDRFVFYLG